MINYYEYDTSPRKIENGYGGTATKEREPDYVRTRTRRKLEEPNYLKTSRRNAIDNNEENNIDLKKIARQERLEQSRRNAKRIATIGIGFVILFTISYRYALINSKFNEKEDLKSELAQIQKENAQARVSIEQGMNVKNIEKEAQERLGMQKLDANSKIYVNLPKKDYIESTSKKIKEEANENWFSKLINILKGN